MGGFLEEERKVGRDWALGTRVEKKQGRDGEREEKGKDWRWAGPSLKGKIATVHRRCS